MDKFTEHRSSYRNTRLNLNIHRKNTSYRCSKDKGVYVLANKAERRKSEKKKESKPQRTNTKKIKKKKISRAETIPEARLTAPKKRSLLNRLRIQRKYNRGRFDYIEDDYDNITLQELKDSKNSRKRSDRRFYKEVQEYEDAYDDVTVRKGWTAFKVGLATIMLCTSIGMVHNVIQDIHDMAPEPPVIITLETATEEQKSIAEGQIEILKDSNEYNFKCLSEAEQVDAMLRIPTAGTQISIEMFKNAIFNLKDQELLDKIVEEAFGEEEFATFSDAKKEELRKIAYETLDDEKKEYSRDPQVLKQIEEEREAQRIQNEANRAEVEERLNHTNRNNDDEIELE